MEENKNIVLKSFKFDNVILKLTSDNCLDIEGENVLLRNSDGYEMNIGKKSTNLDNTYDYDIKDIELSTEPNTLHVTLTDDTKYDLTVTIVQTKLNENTTVMKTLNIGGTTVLNLRNNGRLYIQYNGNGNSNSNCYITSTLNSNPVSMKPNEETEIDMCIKDIKLSSLPNSVCVTDTRNNDYDLFINNYNDNNNSAILKVINEIDNNKFYLLLASFVVAGVTSYVLSKQ